MDEITIEDILNRWVDGEAPYEDDPILLTFFEDAKAEIYLNFTDINERLLKETYLSSRVKRVIAKVIQRAMKADYSGFSSKSENTGPFGESYSKAASTKQGLFLDTDDLRDLAPQGSGSGGLSVISVNSGGGDYGYCWN